MGNQSVGERTQRARSSAAPFESNNEFVAVVGEDGIVLHLSAGWERILDLPIASMLGSPFDRVVSESQAEFIGVESSSDASPLGPDLESVVLLRYSDSDGNDRILEGRTVEVLAGSTDRLLIFRDSTANWDALATLIENERRFRVIAEATRDMVTESDETGRILYASSACEKVLGYKPEELVGTLAIDLLRSGQRDRFLELVRAGAKSNEPFLVPPHRLQHRDGSTVWVEATGLVYRNLDGLRRTVGVARDVSSQLDAEAVRRNLEERVLRSQKLESLGALAAGIAHDFNNLLTPIIGNVGLALLDLPAESPVRKRVEMIRASADRATALTRQMLAYAGQGIQSVEAIDITTAVEEMELLIAATASKSTQIDYELERDLPLIEIDNTHVGQMVINLVANASESFPSTGGRIEIRTGSLDADQAYLDSCFIGEHLEKGLYVYLEVCDDGPGIPDEDHGRIFDPFFSTRFIGRGLGLAAVDGIVRGYNGALELVSQPEQGTRIRVLFPTASRTRLPTHSTELQPLLEDGETGRHSKGTILVVDDDEAACELMATVLARAGFKVIQATGGADGVKFFELHAADINGVVLDYSMPLVSGGEVFDAIRTLRPDARILLVSGYAQARTADELMKRGLVGFLQKPFAPTDLVRNVNRLIDTRDHR